MGSFDENAVDAREKKKNKKKNDRSKDWLVALSSVQLILACICIAVLLLISRISPVGFSVLKDEFARIMQTDMSVSEVMGRIHSAFEPQVKQNYETQETSNVASGGEDTALYAATQNVCFAPFDVTVEPILPVQGEVTSRFGYRTHPITKKFGIHNGTDIAAPEGTPIAAALNGRVEETGFNNVRGNYILLSHGTNTQTLYLHCSEIVAQEGAVVRQGEIIARVGNTGWSTGPHLHFSVLIGGKYCNPEWIFDDL